MFKSKFLRCFFFFCSSTLLLFFYTSSFGQGFPENPTQIKEIPSTPTSWEFNKYGDYPISLHTGVPNISIPLVTAKSGALTVPVSLDYHASGIKVNQKASWVGLGWSLMSGGTITRTIRGVNDEKQNGYINYPFYEEGQFNPAENNNYTTTEEMIQGFIDTEPDLFNYSFLGYSGKFVFNHSEDQSSATISLIPHNDLKITPSFSGNSIQSFTIQTPEGISAEFDYAEASSEYRSAGLIGDLTVTASTTWHLKKLTGPNPNDVIEFQYKTISPNDGSVQDPTISQSHNLEYYDPCNYSNFYNNTTNSQSSVLYLNVKRIERITFDNGYILFSSSENNRLDDTNNEDLKLNKIELFSNLGGVDKLISGYEFTYDYFTNSGASNENDYRLKLVELQQLNSAGTTIGVSPYNFFYKDSGLEKLPARFSYSQDYWGFYNGRPNASLVPAYQHTTISGSGITLGNADRKVYPNYSQAGVINKIVYPTSGYTIFEFESNSVTVQEGPTFTQHYSGGLRVKNIANYDFDNSLVTKKAYEYIQKDNPSRSSGIYNGTSFIEPRDFYYAKEYHYSTNDPCSEPGGGNGIGEQQPQQTKSEGVYSSPNISKSFATAFYSQVKEYNSNPTENEGYTWYHFDSTIDQHVISSGPISFYLDRSWDRGQLLLEETYEKNGTSPIKSVSYEYEEIQIAPPVSGFKPGTRFDVVSLGYYPPGAYIDPYGYRSGQYFLAYYNEPIVWKRLKTKSAVLYGVTTVENYIYDPDINHTNLKKTVTTLSNGSSYETANYYPDDITSNSFLEGGNLTSTAYDAINQMKADGSQPRSNEAIQTEVSENGEKSIYRTNFKQFDSLILPETYQQVTGNISSGNSLRSIAEFKLYSSNGNLLEVSKPHGYTVTYIWGYNGTLPVAKIDNATYSQIENLPSFGQNFNLGSNGLSNAQEEELRSHSSMEEAQVYTFHYDPFVGVTKMIDLNGIISSFEYDNFQRLKQIKDNDDYVLSKYIYNYKSQN